MKKGQVLAIVLTAVGLSLVFGGPWGSLLGAILLLAGVIALRSYVPLIQQPKVVKPSVGSKVASPDEDAEAAATRLKGEIEELNRQNAPVPQGLLDQYSALAEKGVKEACKRFDSVISKKGDSLLDLATVALAIRQEQTWPATGQVSQYPTTSEHLAFVTSRIEDQAGKVRFCEAVAMTGLLSQRCFEREYMLDRLKRGLPSLFNNAVGPHWRQGPGFYEKHLKQRHNNILFAPAKRAVSQYDLFYARQLDDEERAKFVEDVRAVLENIMDGPDAGDFSSATQLRRSVVELMERSSTLYEVSSIRDGLLEGYTRLREAMSASLGSKPDDKRSFDSAQQELSHTMELVLEPYVSHIFRLTDEQDRISALLSSPIETLELVIKHGGEATLNYTRARVKQMLEELPDARAYFAARPEYLTILGMRQP